MRPKKLRENKLPDLRELWEYIGETPPGPLIRNGHALPMPKTPVKAKPTRRKRGIGGAATARA